MDWRIKALLGAVLIVVGAIVALFEAGLLVFMDCAVECPEGRQRTLVIVLVLAGVALSVTGAFMVRRALRDRRWSK